MKVSWTLDALPKCSVVKATPGGFPAAVPNLVASYMTLAITWPVSEKKQPKSLRPDGWTGPNVKRFLKGLGKLKMLETFWGAHKDGLLKSGD